VTSQYLSTAVRTVKRQMTHTEHLYVIKKKKRKKRWSQNKTKPPHFFSKYIKQGSDYTLTVERLHTE